MNTRHHARTGSCGRRLSSPLTKTLKSPTITTRKPSQHAITPSSEDEEDMASFLQFCATCEKQIITPTITVLYCSEACRRRDSTKSIPSSIHYSPPLSPSMVYYDHPTTQIVPRRSPTVFRPLSTTFSQLSLYELDGRKSTDSLDESTFGMPTESRPYLQRTSTSEESNIPSLVHSPASSYGTVETSRPLPRKHSCCTTHKGIDLVTPVMSNDRRPSSNDSKQNPRNHRQSQAKRA